jgi:hypothetical protein
MSIVLQGDASLFVYLFALLMCPLIKFNICMLITGEKHKDDFLESLKKQTTYRKAEMGKWI